MYCLPAFSSSAMSFLVELLLFLRTLLIAIHDPSKNDFPKKRRIVVIITNVDNGELEYVSGEYRSVFSKIWKKTSLLSKTFCHRTTSVRVENCIEFSNPLKHVFGNNYHKASKPTKQILLFFSLTFSASSDKDDYVILLKIQTLSNWQKSYVVGFLAETPDTRCTVWWLPFDRKVVTKSLRHLSYLVSFYFYPTYYLFEHFWINGSRIFMSLQIKNQPF